MSVIVEKVSIECRSPAALLWPLIADTDRLNREAGMQPVSVEPLGDQAQGSARYRVKSRFGPIEAEWLEHPFEWLAPERFGVNRDFTKGPIDRLELRIELLPEGTGTKVQVEVRINPKLGLFSPVWRVALEVMVHRIGEAIRRLDGRAAAPTTLSEPLTPVDAGALERGRQATSGALEQRPAQAVLPDLEGLLRRAPDHELARIRPFALADKLGRDRRQVLEACLAGVIGGWFELRWEVICPSCRTPSAQLSDLDELSENGHCNLCDLSFGLDLDRSVEASFRPSSLVRPVPELQFCTGGPAIMPHVVTQRVVEPGVPLELAVPNEPGRYRIFARGGAQAAIEIEAGAPAQAEITLSEKGAEPSRIAIAPGGKVTLVDRAPSARHVKLERLAWASQAATVHDVSTVGAFRRLFSGAILRPGLGLTVSRVALLFSDLSASTALYAREGDASAFELVQDHFELLSAAIEGHNGAVVKTIGDAVMAAFVDEVEAVRAAVSMQRAFPEFRRRHNSAGGVYLKVGVYAGPCYVVNANDNLDYFGQTVNVAARLQGQAESAEIVLPEALAARGAQAGLFAGAEVSAPFSAVLKGLDAPIQVVRVRFPAD